jgi:Pyruvate/2-oxoacid:ferredoxin oxidoreductase gamma subunit
VALEMNEALRALPMMRCGALAFIYTHRRVPIIAGISGMQYPCMDEIEKIGTARGITSIFVPESLSLCRHHIAEQGRYTVSANVIMLGIVCGYTRIFARSIVEQALCECLPHVAVENLEAFAIGWQYGEKRAGLTT